MSDNIFLTESADDGKLRHLSHPEDRIISHGVEGYHSALHTLDAVHSKLLGEKTPHTTISTKYDGAPSLVFGHHPQTGKFFVATKSAFSKTPKLNYTHEDIVKNHEAGGLRNKLHSALEHLPKITPHHGVYQGDMMYTHHDVTHDNKAYHFKPNTITYSANKNSEEGKKIAKAKMGIVVHTQYHGKTLEDMKAHFSPDMSKFRTHPHVHVISPETDIHHATYSPEAQKSFISHMRQGMRHFKQMSPMSHSVIKQHAEHLNTYINKSITHNEKPSFEGYKKHLTDVFKGRSEKLKTSKGQSGMIERGQNKLEQAHVHQKDFEHMFEVHHHTQEAKNVLVHALSNHSAFGHSIGGKASKPEGFVVSHQGHPSKLVDRSDFSRQNFSREGEGRFK